MRNNPKYIYKVVSSDVGITWDCLSCSLRCYPNPGFPRRVMATDVGKHLFRLGRELLIEGDARFQKRCANKNFRKCTVLEVKKLR